VELSDGKIQNISGYICPKGKTYAENEITAPRRVVTSTVKTADGRILPVKTHMPILKENIFKAMEIINGVEVKTPVKIGQIIYANIEEGIDLIATAEME
jgi:CxxC motif-containing protein